MNRGGTDGGDHRRGSIRGTFHPVGGAAEETPAALIPFNRKPGLTPDREACQSPGIFCLRRNLGDDITMEMSPECIGKAVSTGVRCAIKNSGLTHKLSLGLVRRVRVAQSLHSLSLQIAFKCLITWFCGGTNGPCRTGAYWSHPDENPTAGLS